MKFHSIHFIVCLSLAAVAVAADKESDFAQRIKPLLVKHCFECHGPDQQESGIRFDKLTSYRSEDGTLWTKVYEVIKSGEMPPRTDTR